MKMRIGVLAIFSVILACTPPGIQANRAYERFDFSNLEATSGETSFESTRAALSNLAGNESQIRQSVAGSPQNQSGEFYAFMAVFTVGLGAQSCPKYKTRSDYDARLSTMQSQIDKSVFRDLQKPLGLRKIMLFYLDLGLSPTEFVDMNKLDEVKACAGVEKVISKYPFTKDFIQLS